MQIDDKRVLSAFGEQVKRIRLDIGISQERLALKSGMDRTYIGGIERGKRNVSLLNLFKLATALSVEPRSLSDLNMASSNEQNFVTKIAATLGIPSDAVIFQYLKRKTKASDRGSKARRSLGNLYALYVLAEDYFDGNHQGSSFTNLMQRMKNLPLGAKLQNHPLDNRLNDEVKRQYGISDDMLPVQPADLQDGKKD